MNELTTDIMKDSISDLSQDTADRIEAKAKRIEQIEGFARRIGLYMAVEIGRELSEIKEMLPHGAWGAWVKERLNYSQATVSRYIKLFDEYGADQIGIFGAEPNSSTLQNISVSNALRLLALPEEERESFAEEHDVEHISAREMDKLIRERDEAKKALSDTQEDAKEAISNAEEAAANARREADRLRAELEELRSRPVDVAVQEPDPAMLEQIRAEEAQKAAAATADLEKKLAAAEAKAAKEAEKAKKMKDKADQATAETKAAMQKDVDAAEEARKAAEVAKADAEARAETLERKLKTADGDAAVFKVYFNAVQEDLNRMLGMIQKADAEKAAKYKEALRTVLDRVGGAL